MSRCLHFPKILQFILRFDVSAVPPSSGPGHHPLDYIWPCAQASVGTGLMPAMVPIPVVGLGGAMPPAEPNKKRAVIVHVVGSLN